MTWLMTYFSVNARWTSSLESKSESCSPLNGVTVLLSLSLSVCVHTSSTSCLVSCFLLSGSARVIRTSSGPFRNHLLD
jgi:hypothetical protein